MNAIMSKVQAVVGKVVARNDTAPPVNPPPYVHDHSYRLSRILSAVFLMLLLLLSIPAVVLKAYSYNFIEINAEMGFYLVNDGIRGQLSGDVLVAALPHNLFRVPEKIALVVGMLNILLSKAHLVFIAWDWKAGRRTQTRAFRRNAMIVHMFNAILVLTALIAMSTSHKQSSTFQSDLLPHEPNAVSPSGYRYYRYDSGTFDLETWTCELENADGVGDARKDYRAQCEIEVAGRMILVPLFLAALAVAGLSIWSLAVGGKQTVRSEHIYTKDIDLEVGKSSEIGKQVHVEEVELDNLRLERQADTRLSKIEEDGEESEETPKNATPIATISKSDDSEDMDAKTGVKA